MPQTARNAYTYDGGLEQQFTDTVQIKDGIAVDSNGCGEPYDKIAENAAAYEDPELSNGQFVDDNAQYPVQDSEDHQPAENSDEQEEDAQEFVGETKVEVLCVFSRTTFIGVDLFSRRNVNALIATYANRPRVLADEELRLNKHVLVKDSEDIGYERAIISSISRTSIGVDLIDDFGSREVKNVMECPESICLYRPSSMKIRLTAEPSVPLLRGLKFNVLFKCLDDGEVVLAQPIDKFSEAF